MKSQNILCQSNHLQRKFLGIERGRNKKFTFSVEDTEIFFDSKENFMNALIFLNFYFFFLIEVKNAKRYLILTQFATA